MSSEKKTDSQKDDRPPTHIIRKDYLNSTNGTYILTMSCPKCHDESVCYSSSYDYYGCGSVINDCDFTFDLNYDLAFQMVKILEKKIKKKTY